MELGSWELHIFVSVAVILGTAFIALIVDYLKGSNEQLREHNIELRVRTEETQRRAILDPMRHAHPSILSALRSAVSSKSSSTATGATLPAHAATEESKRAEVHPAVKRPAAVVPATVEEAPAVAEAEHATQGGELLEQVIAATPGAMMAPRMVYREVEPPPAVAESGVEVPEDGEGTDRVVYVTPVEVEEQEEVSSRPLLHQFEVVSRKRPVIADVPEELTAPVKLRLHEKPQPEAQSEEVAATVPPVVPIADSWTSILYDSSESETPEPVASESEPEEAPQEWFREPDSWRSRLGASAHYREPEPGAEPEIPVQAEAEPAAVESPAAAAFVLAPEVVAETPRRPVVEDLPEEERPRPAILEAEDDENLEDVMIFATPAPPVPVSQPAAAAFSSDFDVVYSQPEARPVSEIEAPPISSFERVQRTLRPEPIAWPTPVARPEPIIFSEPAILPKSRLKPEETESWTQAAASAAPAATGQPVPVFAAPRALAVPAGYHDTATLDTLCREEGLFSGLVVAIGINDFKRVQETTGRSGMDSLMQSVTNVVKGCAGDKGFACRTAEDEFLIVHPNEHGPSAQRKLSQVSERLWDFQLRSLGVASIMFTSGSVDVEHERLADAIAGANERMYQTKRSRKTVSMDSSRPKRAVNA